MTAEFSIMLRELKTWKHWTSLMAFLPCYLISSYVIFWHVSLSYVTSFCVILC